MDKSAGDVVSCLFGGASLLVDWLGHYIALLLLVCSVYASCWLNTTSASDLSCVQAPTDFGYCAASWYVSPLNHRWHPTTAHPARLCAWSQ